MVQIAVDGPGGAGKSSLAKGIAKRLGYIYVDTGAFYRAVALFIYRRGIDPRDAQAVAAMLPGIKLDIEFREGEQIVLLCGKEVGAELRTPEISMYASAISALAPVRAFLLNTQRKLAETNNVVMDGRDIGTVIFPNAKCKIFLTASDEIRAQRRYEELKARGVETSLEGVLADMRRRDENDSTRAIAPAVPAEDAVMLDNGGMTEDETVDAALTIIEARGIDISFALNGGAAK